VAINFWDLDHPSTSPALIDGASGRRWSYGDLKRAAALFSANLGNNTRKQLGFILCSNTPECVAAYIGSLQSNVAAALFSADLPSELLSRLVTVYRPDWVFASTAIKPPAGYSSAETIGTCCLWGSHHHEEREISSELGLLLSTSGSTGTPKLVRLSHFNLQVNAGSIRDYLGLHEQERPITSLPMAYSYGLSVINSHLLVGAPILLTNDSVMQKGFWELISTERATSFAGVPYTYQMLLRAGFLQRDLSILTWTQAGGRLETRYIEQVHAIALAKGWRFFVMYGQTEATARISYLPPEQLATNLGSIGIPIPGGNLRVDSESGELVYSGRNVMLGYAENIQDLSKGDELKGELYTGDLGRQDENGFFHITGRKKRFLKVLGLRLSLDDVEATLGRHFDSPLACFGTDDALRVAVEDRSLTDLVLRLCCEVFKLHHSVVRVSYVERLPLTDNGKTDYGVLAMLDVGNERSSAWRQTERFLNTPQK
jgi:long-chain acyl-CoA synthetase